MTNKPNIEALSREFCELTGIEFVEYWWCPKCQEEVSPARVTFDEKCDTCMSHVEWKEMLDFSDAREVLKVMRKGADWWVFAHNSKNFHVIRIDAFPDKSYIERYSVNLDLIEDTTGLLLKEAVEWLRKEKRDERT